MFENGIQLRGAVYRNFAAPGMNQLFRTYVSSSSATLGNPLLAPETNFGQEIGVDYLGDKIKIRVTGFHNQLDNYINRVNICSTSPGYAPCSPAVLASFGLAGSGLTTLTNNQNIGSAIFEGGEASIEWQALETLNLNFGIIRTIAHLTSFSSDFTALNNAVIAQGNTPLQEKHKQLPFVQPWTINAGGTWFILPNLQFNFVIRSWPVYYSDTQHLVGQRLSAATTADISVNYQMSKKLNVFFTAQNLSDKRYLSTNYGTSTTTLPTLAMPLNVMGGINLSF
jgi:outer membrane receptor protein involved in Fe transport